MPSIGKMVASANVNAAATQAQKNGLITAEQFARLTDGTATRGDLKIADNVLKTAERNNGDTDLAARLKTAVVGQMQTQSFWQTLSASAREDLARLPSADDLARKLR